MKINNRIVNAVVTTKHALLGVGLIGLGLLSVSPPVQANAGEATNLVAPYGHFPLAFGPAAGPYTTHYLISSTSGTPSTVNVKCYNDSFGRVGPAGGVDVDLGVGHDMDVFDPVSLLLTTSPSFTGFGWCYFAVTAGDDVAVTFLLGVSQSGNLITTNDSRLVTSGTAQSQVTDDDANIPYWTREGSWDTYFVALNPTTTAQTLTVDIYNSTSTYQTTWLGDGGLSGRDLDIIPVSALAPAAFFGNADVNVGAGSSNRGFVGWISGVNLNSGQAFMYNVPLDKDDLSALLGGDRP
ncbi:MAG: hypothetical protein A2150_04645 [Candidatus Muproteobacteria bacterium RBG_16_64_11]|uniref:Uncharacterized protein n=1 Tax=Candidatus Muproteobacteria bacterium RBG_16_64_11 TaxID=1817758 RepID=A0A1F6TBA0_9PROT|nr:MAG: hypothetical protein A2150_04645 [Candidatus Muproteobacteria bacterium RBG_16_64_11]